MFGYILPNKNELKVRELAEYKAFYCGLCHAISARYGQLPRMSLSYDCAFAALIVSGFYPCSGFELHRCAYKPLKRKIPVARSSPALDFAADLNVLLSWYKLEDDWHDEKKVSALAGRAALYPAAKRAKRIAPELDGVIAEGIAGLSKIENASCAELDPAANAFSEMLANAFLLAPLPDDDARRIIKSIGFGLGRWLYLMDAWDDRGKDKKTGSYNVFNLCNSDEEQAKFLLNFALNGAIDAYDLMDVRSHKGVLDNIMYTGCVEKTIALVGKGKDIE